MKEITDRLGGSAFAPSDDGLEARVFRVMAVSVGLGTGLIAPFMAWRITAGLLLGGLLSLLNYRWMGTSVRALIVARATGRDANARVTRYILRYFVIAAVVVTGYKLNIVSLPATIVGLSSFVVALFAEAFREIYFIIVDREGIN